MIWYKPEVTTPPHGQSILLKFKDGCVHEGHFIQHGNRYVKNVNRFKVYKYGNKTIAMDDVVGWQRMPK